MVRGIAVREMDKKRQVDVDSALVTTDPNEVIDRDDVDIVCELVGGETHARDYVLRAIERGDVIGPRMFPARQSISITGGHCDTTGYAPGILEGGTEQGVADGTDEVLKAVRYQIKHGARVIKTCATAGVLSFEGPVGQGRSHQRGGS